MKVYKQGLERDIQESRWAEYSKAGWTKEAGSSVVEAKEVINLKPAAKVKASAEQANDETITSQGE